MLFKPPSCSASKAGRTTQALLVADHAGGRTVLRRQHVGYPLHVTRAFYLDRHRPDLATLYLQSASGGLYESDRLALDVVVGAGAALNLTTQASTVVHAAGGNGATQHQSFTVHEGGFFAFVSDPYILFPRARLQIVTTAHVAVGAVLIFVDGFAIHDPRQRGEFFDRFLSATHIQRDDNVDVLTDRGSINGSEMTSKFGAMGGMAAAATLFVIAPPERCADIAEIESAAERSGCLAGASAAPGKIGFALRLLAPDGGTLTRGIEAAFHVAARAALGVELARRRK